MAKASTGRAPPAKAKPALSPAVALKKATPAITAAKKKAAAAAPSKTPAAPKMARAPQKAAPRKAAARKSAPQQSVPQKSVPQKFASKAAAAKASSPKTAAGKALTTAAKKVTAKAPAPELPAPAKSAAKTVAVKKAAARRTVVRVAVQAPAARRGRPVPASRKPAAAAPARKLNIAPQTFTVSHLNEADFKTDGLRAYAQYRDLGIAAATGGLCQAHVIRLLQPCTGEVRKRHLHHADLQLVYVLKGWMKNEFEGHGEQMMSTGSCWLQPSGIKHTVLDYSADCEVLEIIVPADFKTEELV